MISSSNPSRRSEGMTDLSMANNTNTRAFDAEAIRRDFPILTQEINGKPLVYLDNGASAQKPAAVLDAMDRYYREMHSNVHRGAHTLGDRATAAFEGAREVVRGFLNAPSTREIIWTRGTTEAINLVANDLAPRLKAGDEIPVSHIDHHAIIVPWQLLLEPACSRVVPTHVTTECELSFASCYSLLAERTRTLAITHVSSVLGTVTPITLLIEQARNQGVLTPIDGAQAVPYF